MNNNSNVLSEKHKNDNFNIEKIPKLRFPEFTEEWEEKKVKNIIKKGKAGGTPKSTIQEYYNGDIPFLSINDMTKQGKYVSYTEKSITKMGLDNSSAWIVPENSILYSMYASVGFVSINNTELSTSQAIYSMILNNDVNIEFIYYSLQNFKKYVHRYIETGTQGNLNSKIVKNIIINLPNTDEQDKIANFLSLFDKKIELLEKTSVLYQKDMTYNINSIYSNLDQYKELKIKDIFENYSSNLSINQLEENAGEYSLYGAEGIIKYIDFYELDKPYISIIKDGAGVGRLNLCEPNSSTLGTLQCLIPKDEFNIHFLYFYLKTLKFEKYIVGSTIPHIYFKDYSKEKLIIPSLNMQNLIGNYFLKFNKRSNLVKNKIKQLQLFKKGLLQKMFV